MGNRYTCGNMLEGHMYHILDNGVDCGAVGSYDAICNIYDECEITGGRFVGMSGVYYGGTYTGGTFALDVIFDGVFHVGGGHSSKYNFYVSENGDTFYG